MAHIGLICPHVPGHQHPMNGLGRELMRRGHRVTSFQLADGAERASAAGLEVVTYGEAAFPLGSAETYLRELGASRGLAALRTTFELLETMCDLVLNELPPKLKAAGVDLVLADEAAPGAGTAAEAAGVPWIGVSDALMVRLDPGCPPIAVTVLPRPGLLGTIRDHALNLVFFLFTYPLRWVLWRGRRRLGLPDLGVLNFEKSSLLHLCQEPAPFTFPRRNVEPEVHFLGPLHDDGGRKQAEFPWSRLDGRPLIYASLGTIQNRLKPLFLAIAEAASALPVQLVLSLGDSCEPEELGALPGDPIVVRWAPQQALLARAAACVTHAGLNTALECLAAGVPMVAMPITNDQPGVAARVVYCGSGLCLPPRPDVPALRAALKRVLDEPGYRDAARRMAEHIRQTRPRERAADLVEQTLRQLGQR